MKHENKYVVLRERKNNQDKVRTVNMGSKYRIHKLYKIAE